jgi:hypothetical protein
MNLEKNDISELLIIEEGYLGCLVISSRGFAIPDLLDHERSRLLLDDSSRKYGHQRLMLDA